MDKELLLLSWTFSTFYFCAAGVLLYYGKPVIATILLFITLMLLPPFGKMMASLPDEWLPDLSRVLLFVAGMFIIVKTVKRTGYRLQADADDPERFREETLRRFLERTGCTLFSVQWKTVGKRDDRTWAPPPGSVVMITYTQPGTSINMRAVGRGNRKAAKLLGALVRCRCFSDITTFILMPQVVVTDKNGRKRMLQVATVVFMRGEGNW